MLGLLLSTKRAAMRYFARLSRGATFVTCKNVLCYHMIKEVVIKEKRKTPLVQNDPAHYCKNLKKTKMLYKIEELLENHKVLALDTGSQHTQNRIICIFKIKMHL